MLNSYLDLEIFSFGNVVISLGKLVGFVLFSLVLLFLYIKVIKVYLPKFYKFFNISKTESGGLKKIVRNIIILLAISFLMLFFKWDFSFFQYENFNLTVSLIIQILEIYQISSFFLWGVDNIIHSYYLGRHPKSKEEQDHNVRRESTIINNIRNIVYLSATISVIKAANFNFQYTTNVGTENFHISVVKVLSAILIILLARFIVWIVTQFILNNIYRAKKIPFAQQFAINQLILYVVYVIAIFLALNYILGAKMTVLYGGAAALLVGVGLGLQQTFNDFFSGLVLLFERSVGVGDVVQLENQIGRVLKIGLRSSLIETRDSITIVVPNSKMVNFNIQNISHEFEVTRFEILVSVAYGTDTSLVEELLLQSLSGIEKVMLRPEPSVMFYNFGADGLDFKLFFYTEELFRVEKVKSQIRFKIDYLFRENNITVPFPQRTVWIKKED